MGSGELNRLGSLVGELLLDEVSNGDRERSRGDLDLDNGEIDLSGLLGTGSLTGVLEL